MKVLFDNGTPHPIATVLEGHSVTFARQLDWQELQNGELLEEAEEAGFDVLVTTDKNMRYQQNLIEREISIIVLGNSQWPNVRHCLRDIAQAINEATPGSYVEVSIPNLKRPT